MPIYEYQCPKCQHVFEEMVSLSQAHGEEPCPLCGAPSPRMISHTSFVLKGGGWYVSDYGYRKGIKEEGSGSAPEAKASSGPEAKASSGGGPAAAAAGAGTSAASSASGTQTAPSA